MRETYSLNLYKVTASLIHHVAVAARAVLVIRGETASGGVADTLGTLPGGSRSTGGAAGDVGP